VSFIHDDWVSAKNGKGKPKQKPKRKAKLKLSPKAQGLDEMTRVRRRALAKMQKMSPAKLFELAVSAGIYTKKGSLTKHYKDDGEPSASRPTD
jgi:hypothetical protein